MSTREFNRFTPLHDRLFSRAVRDELGCWVWSGHQNGWGYGLIKVGGVRRVVHRVAYELLVGPIPDGLVLDHLCRNRACINPIHLEPVSLGENVRRGQGTHARNSRKTHCVHGHAFVGENLLVSGGVRICRRCKRTRGAARRDGLRGAA